MYCTYYIALTVYMLYIAHAIYITVALRRSQLAGYNLAMIGLNFVLAGYCAIEHFVFKSTTKYTLLLVSTIVQQAMIGHYNMGWLLTSTLQTMLATLIYLLGTAELYTGRLAEQATDQTAVQSTDQTAVQSTDQTAGRSTGRSVTSTTFGTTGIFGTTKSTITSRSHVQSGRTQPSIQQTQPSMQQSRPGNWARPGNWVNYDQSMPKNLSEVDKELINHIRVDPSELLEGMLGNRMEAMHTPPVDLKNYCLVSVDTLENSFIIHRRDIRRLNMAIVKDITDVSFDDILFYVADMNNKEYQFKLD